MIILGCDSCGRQSPDQEGRKVADSWVTLQVQTQAQRHRGERANAAILCEECWRGALGAPGGFDLNSLLSTSRNGGQG